MNHGFLSSKKTFLLFPSSLHDVSFQGGVEVGIDALLSQYAEDEIFFSDTSWEIDENNIWDIEEGYISDTVNFFDEVCCAFDIQLNSIQSSSELDASFHHFFDENHVYVANSIDSICQFNV